MYVGNPSYRFASGESFSRKVALVFLTPYHIKCVAPTRSRLRTQDNANGCGERVAGTEAS